MLQLQNGSVTERLIEKRTKGSAVLARLAHFVSRHRWTVIAAWIALTLFGGVRRRAGLEALVPELLDPRQVGLRGEPAHAEGVRRRRAPARRRRLPHERRRDEERCDRARRCSARRRRCPGALTSSYFSTHNLMYVSQRPAHDVRGDLPARPGDVLHDERRRGDACRGRARACRRGSSVQVTGPRPARGGEHARRRAAVERPRSRR